MAIPGNGVHCTHDKLLDRFPRSPIPACRPGGGFYVQKPIFETNFLQNISGNLLSAKAKISSAGVPKSTALLTSSPKFQSPPGPNKLGEMDPQAGSSP